VWALDLFAQEDMAFARRLMDAAVPTELLVVPGAYPGFFFLSPAAAISQQFAAPYNNALSRKLGQLIPYCRIISLLLTFYRSRFTLTSSTMR